MECFGLLTAAGFFPKSLCEGGRSYPESIYTEIRFVPSHTSLMFRCRAGWFRLIRVGGVVLFVGGDMRVFPEAFRRFSNYLLSPLTVYLLLFCRAGYAQAYKLKR